MSSELKQIIQIAKTACALGMEVVRNYQTKGVPEAEVKSSDKTLLTLADKASQEAIRRRLTTIPDLSFWGEEQNKKGFIGEGRFGIIVDPLDGTNAFVCGLMTSTVIVGIYDCLEKKIVGCAIGEPVSGRMWSCLEGGDVLNEKDEVRMVWQGPLQKGNVTIDVSHGFTSRGHQMLTDKGNAYLFGLLNCKAKVLMPGSNGLMQALVANGRERMAGSITTAIGFPGDICGGLLVLQAGGAVIAFRMTDSGLVRTDFVDILEVDAIVCANSIEIAESLAQAFEEAMLIRD